MSSGFGLTDGWLDRFKYRTSEWTGKQYVSVGKNSGVKSGVHIWHLGNPRTNAVANAVALFQILPGIAINLAITSVIARCIGAGKHDQAQYYTKKLIGITYASMILMNVLIYLALPFILHAYHLSPETYESARKILLLHGSCCILIWPISFSLPSTLRRQEMRK